MTGCGKDDDDDDDDGGGGGGGGGGDDDDDDCPDITFLVDWAYKKVPSIV